MAKRTPYTDLVILPYVIANAVCGDVYTGKEMSAQLGHKPAFIAEIEKRRQAMTEEQIMEFCEMADNKCRKAYDDPQIDWFRQLVNKKSSAGRDALREVWIPHWLSGYLAKQSPRIFA